MVKLWNVINGWEWMRVCTRVCTSTQKFIVCLYMNYTLLPFFRLISVQAAHTTWDSFLSSYLVHHTQNSSIKILWQIFHILNLIYTFETEYFQRSITLLVCTLIFVKICTLKSIPNLIPCVYIQSEWVCLHYVSMFILQRVNIFVYFRMLCMYCMSSFLFLLWTFHFNVNVFIFCNQIHDFKRVRITTDRRSSHYTL